MFAGPFYQWDTERTLIKRVLLAAPYHPGSYYTLVNYEEHSLPGAGPLSNFIAHVERRSKILLDSFISYN